MFDSMMGVLLAFGIKTFLHLWRQEVQGLFILSWRH